MKKNMYKILTILSLVFVVAGCSTSFGISSAQKVQNNLLDFVNGYTQKTPSKGNGSHEHTFSNEWDSDENYHWHSSSCGHEMISNKESHDFGNWATFLEPTNSKEGKEKRSCSICGYEETRVIETLQHNHSYSSAWSYDFSYHWHKSLCGDESVADKEEHSFGEWIIKKEARYDIEGLKERSCSICGYLEKDTIEPDNSGEEWTTYKISYNLNGGTNHPNNPNSYTVNDSITFGDPTKNGYTFIGWTDKKGTLIKSISKGSNINLSLNANWTPILFNLSIYSSDTTKGAVSILSGSGYSDETITVAAIPTEDYAFEGWYHDSTKVSNDAEYTFIMPTSDYSLTAQFITKEEERAIKYGTRPILSADGKIVTYGLYPQTNVDDSTLVLSLNALTTPESNGWYLYKGDYYAKVSATLYDSSYKFDNGTTISTGTTYWFKCEPITWNVLSNNDGQYYIVSSVLLDTRCYYNSTSTRTIDGNTIYANNYEYSDIRTWLNADFYNSAFALGNDYILTTTVDNSASTTNSSSNSYACNNTQDKVFLPSYQDYINSSYGFSTSASYSGTRKCRTTDWVRARGAFYYTGSGSQCQGIYWVGSPYSGGPARAWAVFQGGQIESRLVNETLLCIRPEISIIIS